MKKNLLAGAMAGGSVVFVVLLSLLYNKPQEQQTVQGVSGASTEIKYLDLSRFEPSGEGEVSLQLDIVDAEGNPLQGISKEDLTITEEGYECLITDFDGPGMQPVNLIMVIDQSGSMAGEKIEGARQAALGAVGELVTGRDRVSVIPFSTGFSILIPLSDLTEKTEPQFRAQISSIQIAGGTQIGPATIAALQMLKNQTFDGPKLLLVMTDGEDSVLSGYLPQIQTLSQETGAPIFTVAFGRNMNPAANALLSQMAQQCGGQFFAAPTSEALAKVFREQVKETTDKFNVTYLSAFPKPDGIDRRLEVTIEKGGDSLQAKQVYRIGNMISTGRSEPVLRTEAAKDGEPVVEEAGALPAFLTFAVIAGLLVTGLIFSSRIPTSGGLATASTGSSGSAAGAPPAGPAPPPPPRPGGARTTTPPTSPSAAPPPASKTTSSVRAPKPPPPPPPPGKP